MSFIYFWVTGSEAWESRYHENFFDAQGGFLWGVRGALIIGLIGACAFYFGCCNSKKSCKSANISTWAITMLICAVVAYFYADLFVIGDSATTDDTSVFRTYSFYEANEKYYIEQTRNDFTGEKGPDLLKIKNEINDNLDKGGDVRFEYDITTACLAAIFFFITSVFVKRFTINGRTIPFQKP